MAISEQLENENKGLDLLAQSAERGRPIPGQSLTNDPDQAYNWERPPEIVTLQDGTMITITFGDSGFDANPGSET